MSRNFNSAQFSKTVRYSQEASTLGLKPGEVPSSLIIDLEIFYYENKEVDADGDTMLWNYKSSAGSKAVIFND